MGAHLENRTYKQVMATFATFIGTESCNEMENGGGLP